MSLQASALFPNVNEFIQDFTPGSTLSFTVNLSGAPTGLTPTSFSFTIDDDSGFPIPTTDPLTGEQLVTFSLNGAAPLITVTPFAGANDPEFGDYSGVPLAQVTLIATPEPSSWAMLVVGCSALLFTLRLRRKQA